MNTLSLFLYIADVISRVQGLFAFGAVIVGVSWLLRVVITGFNNDCEYDEKKKKPYPNPFRPAILFALFAFTACIIPSKETMYLIAGSEIGEVVVTSPEGQEVFKETKDAILRVVKGVGRDKAED